MTSSDEGVGRPALKRALHCLFASGFAAAPSGALWGFILALPVGAYCWFTCGWAGFLAVPIVALAGPVVGAFLAFHVGAALGMLRAGYRWLVLLVPVPAAAIVLPLVGLYLDGQQKDKEGQQLIVEVRGDDPAPFLANLRSRRSQAIVQDHLEQFLVCAGLRSRPEVVDALAALDPHGKEGFALCGVAQYGQPAIVAHLIGEGYQPARAHRLSGASCEPLVELTGASRATAPCTMLGDSDQFDARPTAEGCKHRMEVAALLVGAGAPTDAGAPFRLSVCEEDAGPAPAE